MSNVIYLDLPKPAAPLAPADLPFPDDYGYRRIIVRTPEDSRGCQDFEVLRRISEDQVVYQTCAGLILADCIAALCEEGCDVEIVEWNSRQRQLRVA